MVNFSLSNRLLSLLCVNLAHSNRNAKHKCKKREPTALVVCQFSRRFCPQGESWGLSHLCDLSHWGTVPCDSPRSLERNWFISHTARRCDGRQEGCERGYYDLHRNLNETLLHLLISFSFVVLTGRNWKCNSVYCHNFTLFLF